MKRGIMKRIIVLFLISGFIFCAPVSQNDAENIAENFYNYKNDPRENNFTIESTQIYSIENENIFYIITLEPSGFILISYDDVIRPILAYSFENQFRFDNIPTNIDYIFNLYNKQIVEQRERNDIDQEIILEWEKFSRVVEYQPQTRNVNPLITARFDQGSPWNDMCPEDSEGDGGNVLVGCVAVSMAQIMHYWSYPEVGYGVMDILIGIMVTNMSILGTLIMIILKWKIIMQQLNLKSCFIIVV